MIDMCWLNTVEVTHPKLEKPCNKLGYCPYGSLVELFPFRAGTRSPLRCPTFGHDCPVHYHAELILRGGKKAVNHAD